MRFEFSIEADLTGDAPDFRGAYVQGKRGERFLYLSLGRQTNAGWVWTRRMKIPLKDITPAQIEARNTLQAMVDGRQAATVKLLRGWQSE